MQRCFLEDYAQPNGSDPVDGTMRNGESNGHNKGRVKGLLMPLLWVEEGMFRAFLVAQSPPNQRHHLSSFPSPNTQINIIPSSSYLTHHYKYTTPLFLSPHSNLRYPSTFSPFFSFSYHYYLCIFFVSPTMAAVVALFVITLAVFSGTVSADPDMLQDVCVADLTSGTQFPPFPPLFFFCIWESQRSSSIFSRMKAGEAQNGRTPPYFFS